MKNIAVISVLLLFICSMTVYAVDERSQTLTTLPLCDSFSIELINSSLQVDAGEFSFHSCAESQNVWFCNCSSNYPVNLFTKINTLNTYTFQLNVSYSVATPDQHFRRSGFSFYVGTVAQNTTTNVSQVQTNTTTPILGNVSNVTKPIVSVYANDTAKINQTVIPIQKESFFGWKVLVIVLSIIAVLLFLVWMLG